MAAASGSELKFYSREHKRVKICAEPRHSQNMTAVACLRDESIGKANTPHSKVINYSDPFALPKHLENLDAGEYGSATKEYEVVHAQWMQLMNLLSAAYPAISNSHLHSISQSPIAGVENHDLLLVQRTLNPVSPNGQYNHSTSPDVIDLDLDCSASSAVLPPLGETRECGGRSTFYLPGNCISGMDVSSGKLKEMPCDPSDLYHKNNVGMNCKSVIVIDSDEEDGGVQIGNRHTSYERKAFIEVQLESPVQSLTNLKKRIRLEGDEPGNALALGSIPVDTNWQLSYPYEKVVLQSSVEERPFNDLVELKSPIEDRSIKDLLVTDFRASIGKRKRGRPKTSHVHLAIKQELDSNSQLNVYNGLQDMMTIGSPHRSDTENDGLTDIWKEMTLAMEFSKDAASDNSVALPKEVQECEHSCFLKDDLGYVCRICGVIQKSIETIFDYQWIKATKSTRTYLYGSRNTKENDQDGTTHSSRVNNEFGHDLADAEISVHPRHMKQMRPHQLEGFNFLLRNLVTEKPGGCILAHAPGSGKTFMIISFIQSFLAKYPHSRTLVVLPKGILPTWKKEFKRWQVEDIPLLDFYSEKADNRSQQLEVLKNWEEHKSILFLGYKQFANIVCGSENSKTAAACQEKLLVVPSLLVLDEGHTPRNENTDVLHSLAKVKTPCKVVLSGTLFQNHVREVFNILNLVRPKFLKMEPSRSVVRRVLSRVQISGGIRRQCRSSMDTTFFDSVEETLQHDDDFRRKVTVIQDLREMTSNVLHYYKGDFLEELPGFVDFTVLLNLTPKQKEIVKSLKHLDRFRRSCVGSAVYLHPDLKEISDSAGDKGANFNDEKMDQILEKIDVKNGVKTKFFLNILGLSESAGEKMLVFSKYLLPLKFLERLLIHMKGWSPGKEIFTISGDSNPEYRESAMDSFNNSPYAKVLFGSIKACGEGISLVGASRVLILDVHLNPAVTRQAIGRAFRPGQLKKVYTYRLVASDTQEERDHHTSFRKELISKMWFEWSEVCSHQAFEMEEIDVKSCEDMFLESPLLGEDVKLLYKR